MGPQSRSCYWLETSPRHCSLVGVVADRLERRWLLIVCELGQALAIGTIVIAEPPLVPLLALVAIQSLVAHLFQTAARSAVPDLVADEDFERANALVGGGTYGLEGPPPIWRAGDGEWAARPSPALALRKAASRFATAGRDDLSIQKGRWLHRFRPAWDAQRRL